MRAVAEREMVVVAAAEVEAIGIGEARRIAVGGAEQQGDHAALADRYGRRSRSRPLATRSVSLHRAVVAQELLDGRCRSTTDRPAAGAARSGLRSSASTALAIRLVVVSWPAPRMSMVSDSSSVSVSVCPWSSTATSALIRSSRGAAPALGEDRAHVGGDLVIGAFGRRQAVDGLQRIEQHRQRIRPVLELRAVRGRNAEQLGDDDDRQRIGEVVNQLHLAAARATASSSSSTIAWTRAAQPLDHTRRERLVDQPAQARVRRRIGHQQRALDRLDELAGSGRGTAAGAGRRRPAADRPRSAHRRARPRCRRSAAADSVPPRSGCA